MRIAIGERAASSSRKPLRVIKFGISKHAVNETKVESLTRRDPGREKHELLRLRFSNKPGQEPGASEVTACTDGRKG